MIIKLFGGSGGRHNRFHLFYTAKLTLEGIEALRMKKDELVS
jgi:hypothetical protein